MDARALTLLARATSPQADHLVATLTGQIYASESSEGRTYRRRASGQEKLYRATEALVGGLLLNASRSGAEGWSWQNTMAGAFTCQSVGSRQFQAARKGLKAAGLIEERASFTRFYSFDEGAPAVDRYATRLRQTPSMVSLAASHGIALEDAGTHFHRERSGTVAAPIVLTGLSVRDRGESRPGRPLPVPDSNEAREILAEIAEVNRFVRGFSVQGCDPIEFRRRFTVDLNHGGRWYPLGGTYMTMKKAARAGLRIEGKPVVEIDVRASHFTLLRAQLGLDPLDGDPYVFQKIPRELSKAWVVSCLGQGRPPKRWSRRVLEKQRDDAAEWGVRKVGAAILERYPFLATVAEALGCSAQPRLTSLKLMAIEAAALTNAMRMLRQDGKLSLPLHDALIVSSQDGEAARKALRQAYSDHAGVRPVVT